jgi:hypothetical protein
MIVIWKYLWLWLLIILLVKCEFVESTLGVMDVMFLLIFHLFWCLGCLLWVALVTMTMVA